MKRILYVHHGQYPWDIRAEKICNSFAESGYEVWLMARCGKNQGEYEKIGNVNLIRIGCNQKRYKSFPISYNPLWYKSIKYFINKIKPDIIITREMHFAEAVGKIGHKLDIPVLIDMAENYPAAMKVWRKYSKSMISRLIVHKLNIPDLIEKRAVQNVDGIIVVCEEQIYRLENAYKYPNDKVCIAHNTPLKKTFADAKKYCNAPPIYFGHHGYLSGDKKVNLLIEAFDIAADKFKDIYLTIAGWGECFDEIQSLVNNCKNKDRINLLGKYAHNNLPEIIGGIDIGVIPYEINDFNNYTVHNKIFDYFACGKPVIATPMVPTKRIIEETDAGWVLSDYSVEALVDEIIKSRETNAVEMKAENAYKAFAEKYNWENDFNNILQFIERYV